MSEYKIIYEQGTDGGWGAYVPDLPGLGVAAESLDKVTSLIHEGMGVHIAGLREDGLPVPRPSGGADKAELKSKI